MYIIYRNKKHTFKSYTFASYDSARLFVRKLLRLRDPIASKWDWDYSNPTLGEFGYSIKKI